MRGKNYFSVTTRYYLRSCIQNSQINLKKEKKKKKPATLSPSAGEAAARNAFQLT